jgi:hypothetical protein
MARIISNIHLHGLKNETHIQFHKSVDSVFVKFNHRTTIKTQNHGRK